MSNVHAENPGKPRHSKGFAVVVVTVAYVAVTLAESILAPVLPIVADDMGLTTASVARMLGVLSLSAGVGNLFGGWLVSATSARTTTLVACGGSALGTTLAAAAPGEALLLGSQFVIGFSAGSFFAGGAFSIGVLSPADKLGRAMGRYGIAYSLALALAAGIVAVTATGNWRVSFIIAALVAVAMFAVAAFVPLPSASPVGREGLRDAMGLLGAPVLVGGVAALAQFGIVAYIPLFGVDEWGMAAAAAALVLFVGRIVSIPGKAVAGWMIDGLGAKRSARITGLSMIALGLVWVLSPVVAIGVVAAILLATAAGAMFPMANVVAIDRFGDLGGLLGVFRALQMVVAGLSAWLIGALAEYIGLTGALIVGLALLASVLFLDRGRPQPDSAIEKTDNHGRTGSNTRSTS